MAANRPLARHVSFAGGWGGGELQQQHLAALKSAEGELAELAELQQVKRWGGNLHQQGEAESGGRLGGGAEFGPQFASICFPTNPTFIFSIKTEQKRSKAEASPLLDVCVLAGVGRRSDGISWEHVARRCNWLFTPLVLSKSGEKKNNLHLIRALLR